MEFLHRSNLHVLFHSMEYFSPPVPMMLPMGNVYVQFPKSLNALYNSICVGVSEDGFKSPSTLFPSRSMTTISSGESLS